MAEDIWKHERIDMPLAMRAFAAGIFMKIAVNADGYGYQMHGGHGEQGAFLKRIPKSDFERIMKTKIRDSKNCLAMVEFYKKFVETSADSIVGELQDFSKTIVIRKELGELQACGRVIVVRRKRQDITEKDGWIDLKLTPWEVAYYFVKMSRVLKETTICTNAAEGKEVAKILGLQRKSFKECF